MAGVNPGRVVRSLRLRAADAADVALGRRDRLTPPRRLLGFVGDSDFQATGAEFLGHLRTLGGLEPGSRVLDVGCGIGRIARVLAGELRPPGSYDGFDIVGEAIAWCQGHYDGTPAPFRFLHADVANPVYNPAGTTAAAEYRFPYPAGAFDLVLATSVFTHLLEAEARRYLGEAARGLAPGGRLFTTWFLLDADGTVTGQSAGPRFGRRMGAAAVADPAIPEAAVAYREPWLRSELHAAGLCVREPLHPGAWPGRPGLSFQDIVVAERPAAADRLVTAE